MDPRMTGRKIYFLHVPRAGGSNLYSNLAQLGFSPGGKHLNGNPVDQYGDWIPFWYWDEAQQRDFFRGRSLVVNERTAGPFMFPEFTYIVCVRAPLAQRQSLFRLWCATQQIAPSAMTAELALHYGKFCRSYPENLLLRMLANRIDQHPVTEVDYARAILRLDRFNVLLLSQLAEDFAGLFRHPFAAREPNANDHAYDAQTFPDSFADELRRANSFDLKLYAAIVSQGIGRAWLTTNPFAAVSD